MHEYSLVQALLEQVEGLAHGHGATSVKAVHVALGELAGVERRLFETAYDTIRAGSVCADAPLHVRAVPARWACSRGHGPVAADGPKRCPSCEAPAKLVEGEELILERIEMEVP
jgi:hydrogenase nickel incorporation protein HypA/HybF